MIGDCICGHVLGPHLNPDTGDYWHSIWCFECDEEAFWGERANEGCCMGYFQKQDAA